MPVDHCHCHCHYIYIYNVNSFSFSGGREYCQFTLFNVSCASNEVILMKWAKYGRMRVGQCVSKDYGYLQCSTDMLNELDRRCSGRRSCSVPVADLRDAVQPCPNDLTVYLEADYTCVQGKKQNEFRNLYCVFFYSEISGI